jgi:hypothetical protein
MSVLEQTKNSDLNFDTDDGKMWHIYMIHNPNITLCGKKLTDAAQRAKPNEVQVECIVCAEIMKRRHG